MRYLIGLIFAYVLAAPLTELISFDLRETEWLNILTYVWLAFGGLVWCAFAFFALIIAAALVSR